MNIFVTGLREPADFTRKWFNEILKSFQENGGDYQFVSRWQEADRILLLYGTDYIWGLSSDEKEMLRKKSEVIFTWNGSDQPAFLFPGLYANLSQSKADQGRFRSYCFPTFNATLESLRNEPLAKIWKYSFSRAPTCGLRKQLFKIKPTQSEILIENTEMHQEWNPAQTDWNARKERYSRNLLQSHFVLCPRGAGIGSIRLFETLQAGSVPVIIADDYQLPEGPSWDQFSVRISEKRVTHWEKELEEKFSEAASMGKQARAAWEHWFSPRVWFPELMRGCDAISKSRTVSERKRQYFWPVKRVTYRLQTEIPSVLRNLKRMIRS